MYFQARFHVKNKINRIELRRYAKNTNPFTKLIIERALYRSQFNGR